MCESSTRRRRHGQFVSPDTTVEDLVLSAFNVEQPFAALLDDLDGQGPVGVADLQRPVSVLVDCQRALLVVRVEKPCRRLPVGNLVAGIDDLDSLRAKDLLEPG